MPQSTDEPVTTSAATYTSIVSPPYSSFSSEFSSPFIEKTSLSNRLTSFLLKNVNFGHSFEIDDTHIVQGETQVCHLPSWLIIRVIPTLAPPEGGIPQRSTRRCELLSPASKNPWTYLSGPGPEVDRPANCLYSALAFE
jgi:hypothetical protein